MTPEQKQRALQILRRFEQANPMARQADNAAVDMAALLRELIEQLAPARTGSSQIEPPADLVRDAERWLSEHDLELLVTFGMQADDCDADGHTLSKEQTRRLCELGVLRNVGFGRHEMTAFGDSIFGVYFSQGISLPLQTHAEYNAAIERNKQKGGKA